MVRAMWRACVLPAIAFATGCHLAFPIEPFDEPESPGTPEGDGPSVFSSPGPAPMRWGGYAGPHAITLAAADPDTIIYYTTDGSTPTEASSSGTTPVGPIMIEATTTVSYFGVLDGAAGEIVTEEFAISPETAKPKEGYLVTNTTLDGTSPVVISPAGATLAAETDFEVWVQIGAPGNTAQIVYGVGEVAQDCLYSDDPSAYPGVTRPAHKFMVKAPSTKGVHEIRIAHIEELSCGDAVRAKPLLPPDPIGTGRPTQARIGVIIVR